MRLIRTVAAIAFLLLGVVIGALNMQYVQLDLGFARVDASLGVLVLAVLVLGMVLGAVLLGLGVPLQRRIIGRAGESQPRREV
ncbi:MAG: DUF1049 domain-containing protein [Xanthomonadales bacterium]|nr:DUF1049 domain-containing protein [Xanthomonadales bacterium]